MFVLIKKIISKIDRQAAFRAVCCALIAVLAMSIAGFDAKCNEIRDNVLRLHILANSDADYDQELKLKVRDRLLTVSNDVFGGCETEAEAVTAAKENIQLFCDEAKTVIYDNGFDYDVKVEVAETMFETRDYENFSLPAGNYEALRVIIGEGEGKNWWCVMFPAVCLPAAGKNQGFSGVLSDASAEIVEQPARYKARFRVVELYEKAKSRLSQIFN